MNSTNPTSSINHHQTIRFDADGYQLVGTLHLPSGPHPPVVIGCHGLLADRNSPKQIALAAACNDQGFAYFRFDHRGCGDSQGEFNIVTSLAARCSDLVHAVGTMQRSPDLGPLTALFGSSFGGTVVLAYAARNPSPSLITYAAPLNSQSIRRTSIRDNQGNRPDQALLTDALAFDIAPDLKYISNILVTHSQDDETVPADHARQIHAAVGDPKKLIIFPDGDHRMSDPDQQQQFQRLFVDWLKKHPPGT